MKNLNDFIDGHKSVLVILKQPFNTEYIAFVGTDESVSELSSALTAGSDESFDITHGLFKTDWYPAAFGNTIEEAIINLNVKVSAFISDSGTVELYELAYCILSNNLFSFDQKTWDGGFNKLLSQNKFPNWLRKYSTLSPEKLYQLQEGLRND